MSFYSRRVSIKRETHQADAIGLKTRVCDFVAVPEQFKEAGILGEIIPGGGLLGEGASEMPNHFINQMPNSITSYKGKKIHCGGWAFFKDCKLQA